MGLSARAYDHIPKGVRTIADLEEMINVEIQNVAKAIKYRNLEKLV